MARKKLNEEEQKVNRAVSKVLYEIRRIKGLTQTKMAEHMRVEYNTYHTIENNTRSAKVFEIYNLCYSLDFDPELFFKKVYYELCTT